MELDVTIPTQPRHKARQAVNPRTDPLTYKAEELGSKPFR
jgi:hypothetical protein